MSDKSIVLKAFLNQFTEFVEDIQNVFPDNADIDSAKTALFLLKRTNPRILLSTWITFIAEPYGAQIEKGDIGFFLEKDYTQDLEYMGNAVMQKVDTFRKPVREMGPENQAKTMKYIQNLSKLATLHGEVQWVWCCVIFYFTTDKTLLFLVEPMPPLEIVPGIYGPVEHAFLSGERDMSEKRYAIAKRVDAAKFKDAIREARSG